MTTAFALTDPRCDAAAFAPRRSGRHLQLVEPQAAPRVTRAAPPRSAVFAARRLFVAAVATGLLLVTLNAVLGVLSVPGSAGTGAASDAPALVVREGAYRVQPGDTLWGVATRLHRGGDIRDTVDELAEINGGESVRVGQALIIPAHLVG